MIRRGSPIHDAVFKSLEALQADHVRFVPWLPYPKLAVVRTKIVFACCFNLFFLCLYVGHRRNWSLQRATQDAQQFWICKRFTLAVRQEVVWLDRLTLPRMARLRGVAGTLASAPPFQLSPTPLRFRSSQSSWRKSNIPQIFQNGHVQRSEFDKDCWNVLSWQTELYCPCSNERLWRPLLWHSQTSLGGSYLCSCSEHVRNSLLPLHPP